jgi:endonuclease-3
MFPVDTHIHRIALRLGLVPPKTTAEQTAERLKPLIVPEDRYETHVLMIEHGRRTCRAINPKCEGCPLLRMCPTGQHRVKRGSMRARRRNCPPLSHGARMRRATSDNGK